MIFKRSLVLLTILLLVACGIYGFRAMRPYLFADNFGIVEEGLIYRSGRLHPFQLERVVSKRGIRTILYLHFPESDSEWFERHDERLSDIYSIYGIQIVPIVMTGDGLGGFERLDEALDVLRDEANLPALICCARGTHRTGAVAASYRVLVQGWDEAEALEEMELYRFRPYPHRYGGDPHRLLPYLEEYFQKRLAEYEIKGCC